MWRPIPRQGSLQTGRLVFRAGGITTGHRLLNAALYLDGQSHVCRTHGRKGRVGSGLGAAEKRQGGTKPPGPKATLRVLLASRAPFHAVTLPDLRSREGGAIFHPAQTGSLINRRFLFSFGVFYRQACGETRSCLSVEDKEDLSRWQDGRGVLLLLLCLVVLLFFSWK